MLSTFPFIFKSLWRGHFRIIQAGFHEHHTKRNTIKLIGGGVAVWRGKIYSQDMFTSQFPAYHLSLGTSVEGRTPHGLLVTGTKKEIRNDVELFPLTPRHRWRLHSYHIVCFSAVPEAINYHNDGSPVIYFFLVSWCFCCITSRHWVLWQQAFVLEISYNCHLCPCHTKFWR